MSISLYHQIAGQIHHLYSWLTTEKIVPYPGHDDLYLAYCSHDKNQTPIVLLVQRLGKDWFVDAA